MSAFLNTETLKTTFWYKSVHVITRITKKKFDEDLKKWFANTYKFSSHDIKKFILLLRKGVYPYEYMDQREKFNETQLPEKEEFYSNLHMEDITAANKMHAKRVCKDSEMKKLTAYHDMCVQSS